MTTRKLSHEELLKRQSEARQSQKLPLVVLVNNVRSLYNVGSLFRTADGVGVERIILCGITGIPPSNKISKTALDAEKEVAWEYYEHATEAIQKLKDDGYRIALLEQTHQSIPYQEYYPEGPVCLILGNEVEGVGEDLLPHADDVVEVEMAGLKNSLNVTVAFGVVAYHIRHQLLEKIR